METLRLSSWRLLNTRQKTIRRKTLDFWVTKLKGCFKFETAFFQITNYFKNSNVLTILYLGLLLIKSLKKAV
jgi:hypothetical protein